YISSLPSNIAIFVDREKLETLAENMKESLSVDKCITTLEKKNYQDDLKSKKVSFKDDSNKKTSKDPFDVESLQKVLKTMTNEMEDIKK
ncbi:hypothetical protein, partial [Pseudonocardia sp. EV170527-09]|uniref:hypothetical protein n=1 Tax=Pseudonocardia sp. EV170527-09 TaxID=2603411 RepID=UPI0019610EEB